MKIEALDKKYEVLDKDSIFENYEILLSKKEAESLIKRLENGPNEKAKEFLKESIDFYKEMKSKEEQFKKEKA